jgi:hypothetical protein
MSLSGCVRSDGRSPGVLTLSYNQLSTTVCLLFSTLFLFEPRKRDCVMSYHLPSCNRSGKIKIYYNSVSSIIVIGM